jgi:phosphopantothenoylcysteine decarboxylase / phosphopantothenate---cysteine ligase
MATKKRVLLGISGGIACYKAAEVARKLIKSEIDVFVVMTTHAMEFVTPLTFSVLTGNKVSYDMFDREVPGNIPHISLARETDLVLIAPATANIIGKIAHGIADDLLSTLVMSSTQPKVLAPAMNCEMYKNPIIQKNMATLKELGYGFIDPGTGELACGEEGVGRLAEPEVIVSVVLKLLGK